MDSTQNLKSVAATPHSAARTKSQTSAEERARLRRNQQNSRARKQAYVGDLERRWTECVAQGAQASTELQKEARRVLSENQQLRAMLHELGVDHAFIQQRLASQIAMDQFPEASTPALPVQCEANCRRPDAAAQLDTSHNTVLLRQNAIIGGITDSITDWDAPGMSLNETMMSEWDVPHWLQDLTDLKDAFGSQVQANIPFMSHD